MPASCPRPEAPAGQQREAQVVAPPVAAGPFEPADWPQAVLPSLPEENSLAEAAWVAPRMSYWLEAVSVALRTNYSPAAQLASLHKNC